MIEQEMYIIVPDSLIDNPEINLLDVKLYGRVRRLKLGCNASHSTLAKWCGCTRRSIIRSIQKLKRLGWLVQDKQGFLVPASGFTSDPDVTGGVTSRIQASDLDVTLPSDPDVTHTNIYITNIDTINKIPTVPKKTLFDKKTSITKEQYQDILKDPKLANNDREFLLQAVLEMEDWSQGKGEKRIDWAASLRNWIRKNRKNNYTPKGVANPKQPKTFRELEDDWQQRQYREFLQEVKQKKGEIEYD